MNFSRYGRMHWAYRIVFILILFAGVGCCFFFVYKETDSFIKSTVTITTDSDRQGFKTQ